MPSKRRKFGGKGLARRDPYGAVLADVVGLLDEARRNSARAVNALMTATYWQVGRRIVEGDQRGAARATYGDRLLTRLSADLTDRFGRGFSVDNLEQMRRFYAEYPCREISETASRKSRFRKSEMVSRKLTATALARSPGPTFPLPWSHYVRLLAVENPTARRFYEAEALRGGWTVRQLDRQVGSLFYERTAMSRDKGAMLTVHNRARPDDRVSAEQEIKDPFVLEFLGLKDEYSEADVEEALVRDLETFLLELGGDFAFIGRQRRLRVGDTWYRIDLLFFHRRLRCLVIVDLKLGPFTHADAGQMNLYCNYAAAHWTNPGENPPVGLILCAGANSAVARYALDGLPNKILAAKYRMALPDEEALAALVEQTRGMLEGRGRRKRRAVARRKD